MAVMPPDAKFERAERAAWIADAEPASLAPIQRRPARSDDNVIAVD
jgi:hypothetical protein